jgi:PIN domain nuclease of toxin-antitoxin system
MGKRVVWGMIYLDTHILVWLYDGEIDLLSDKAKKLIEKNSLVISPIVKLELEYLHEIKRLKDTAEKIFQYLNANIGLELATDSFTDVVNKSIKEKWTRDPFDRIITAHARFSSLKLLTKDEKIHKHYNHAVW